jgi:hypothetical protein
MGLMNTSRGNDTGICSNDGTIISKQKSKKHGGKSLQCHSIHHESFMNSSGIETEAFNKKPASNNLSYDTDFLLLLL